MQPYNFLHTILLPDVFSMIADNNAANHFNRYPKKIMNKQTKATI
jgi:hypothetical protein